MKSIYKTCVLSGPNTIDRIIVFAGANISDTHDKNLALLDPYTNQPIFSESERGAIEKDKLQVIFSSQQIHPDDTVSAIKYKIAAELERSIRVEEIYLFCLRSESHSPEDFYRALTQNNRSQLIHSRMHNALNNFKGDGINPDPIVKISEVKEVYRYDDVMKIHAINGNIEINTAHMLGQRLFLMKNSFPTSYNPFDEIMYDKLLVSGATNAMTTTNSGLLLDSGEIIDGIIYVCLASDVLDNVKRTSPQITDKYLISIYFPLLAAQNIYTKPEINAVAGREPIEKNGPPFDIFAQEDLLHRVHTNMGGITTAPFNWDRRGIAEIKIAMHQKFTLKVPLDVIFKLIPTHPGGPITKLNPGGHRENMYRLYGEKMATDGRKIPQLSRTTINHLIMNMGTTKGVSVYFVLSQGEYLTCDFEENGDIIVYGKFENPYSIEDVGDLIAKHVNPLIKTIEPFFIQSGYKHDNFGSLYDKHVEIIHMNYVNIVNVDIDVSKITLSSIHNCISPAFILETSELKSTTGAVMRYRKVSNFDRMSSQEAFVISQLKRHEGFKGDSLLQSIMVNYNMSVNEASELVARVGSKLTVENGIGMRTTRIRANPGFLTIVSDVTEKGLRSSARISISISSIDNIRYIPMIDEYIGTMLRMLLDADATNKQFPTLASACAAPFDVSTESNVNAHIEDVIGVPDRGIMEQQDVIVEDGEAVIVDSDIEMTNQNVLDNVPDGSQPITALDLLYSDDEYSSSEETEQYGGERNIVGMRLKKPSTFMTAMEEADPELFLKAKSGNFDRYSRTCDAAYGRQPVILTKEEHAEMIATERAGIIERYGSDAFFSLDSDAQSAVIRRETETDDRYTVSYGSSPDKQYVYICPRYWCLKTNTFIHPKEMQTVIENGKEVIKHPTCGGVIPRGQDKVQDDGNYVYEFTGDSRKGKGGVYAPNHPGFLDGNKHPKGYCVPCCFKLNIKDGEVVISDKQLARRKECVTTTSDDNANEKDNTSPQEKFQPTIRHRAEGQYIMDQNTSPIPYGRWAYLNIETQNFFKEYAVSYQVPNTPTQLRPHVNAILRHGVEASNTQSFLACMADVMFFGSGDKDISLSDFREYLANLVTLELFVGLQNGNLAHAFANTEITTPEQLEQVDVSEFKDSSLYQKNTVQTNDHYFVRIVLAYKRFLSYLRSPSAIIDHTYTWDLVCASNIHKSHPNGINLIILEVPESDTTTNLSILCPSNHYSTQQFLSSRPSVFIVKRDNIFEPIYNYNRNEPEKDVTITPFFHTTGPNVTTLQSVISTINNIVKPLHNKRCVPLQSMPRTYTFQQPILFGVLLNVLREKTDIDIRIKRQVLNFSRKVIGLEVSIGDIIGYIPCYPSGYRIISDSESNSIPTTFMDDMTIYHTYVDTLFFSDLVSRTFGSDIIPMRSAYKIVDEEMVIGILTNADQFIMFSEPIELSTTNDDIPILRQSGRVEVESMIQTGETKRDEDRIDHINKIRLETNFFLAYRNTIRILLNDYTNLSQRNEIEERIKDTFIPHQHKLETIVTLLKKLIGPTVQFSEDINPNLLQDVSVCINRQPQQCTTANPVCVVSAASDESDELCTLVIPKTNLVSPNVDNETIYIYKLADQLIRYEKIRKYMMDPTQFLSFGQAHYNLGEYEFVVAQTVLKNEYFIDLIVRKSGSGEQKGTYDETNPDTRNHIEYLDTFTESDLDNIASSKPKKLTIKKMKI